MSICACTNLTISTVIWHFTVYGFNLFCVIYLDIFRTVPVATFLRAEVYVIAICSLHIYCMGCIQIEIIETKKKIFVWGDQNRYTEKPVLIFQLNHFFLCFVCINEIPVYFFGGERKIYIHLSLKKMK